MFDPISAALKPLDEVAVAAEKEWGADVLPWLVSLETRAKFRRAQERLNEAIQGGDFDTIKGRADALIRGWKSLDEEARKLGYSQDNIPVHIGISPDGVVYVFCEDKLTAKRYVAKHPEKASATLTFDQAASIFQSYSVANIKRHQLNEIDPNATVGEILRDELPF